jgi:glycosyltransferase involved in cell wall biosynthesis
MKIAIIDLLGLTYDGNTLNNRGLGGSESAVILMSSELAKLGYDVTVYCSCIDSEAKPGIYDGVRYIDHSQLDASEQYDIAIASRTVQPFRASNPYAALVMRAQYRVLWMHDTFTDGDQDLEAMVVSGFINRIFTLSDFHTVYATNCDHGARRNFEMLKPYIFQTRNGAVKHIADVDVSAKDRNLFVYNASATKGLIPLVRNIWPRVKTAIPDAKLICIGGYYRFREGAEPDEQERTVRDLVNDKNLAALDVQFTGVIKQSEIARILANASFMLYPTAFPETFGISSLESLLYRTPIITARFGALEETAIDSACYKLPYSTTPNSLFPRIDERAQAIAFVEETLRAYYNPYLLQQKQHACAVVDDIHSWDTVALQWHQHFYRQFKLPLPVDTYRAVTRINSKVARIFGRRFSNEESTKTYSSYGPERRIVVISPFYNAELYIKRCIDSVAQQDYDNYVHYLIDDVSTDQSYLAALNAIEALPRSIKHRFRLMSNETKQYAIGNQFYCFGKTQPEDIVMLLDGDDWLVSNNSIFKFYNDIYAQGYDFTYGSMWSLADNIPLVAQQYPSNIVKSKTYRSHKFNWGIPYTHLRTTLGVHTHSLESAQYKRNEKWFTAGADNPLFYDLIERSNNPLAVQEIVCNYNDLNPINDYKVNSFDQKLNSRT